MNLLWAALLWWVWPLVQGVPTNLNLGSCQGFCFLAANSTVASAGLPFTVMGSVTYPSGAAGLLLDTVTLPALNASSDSLSAIVSLVGILRWQRISLVAMDTPGARAALQFMQTNMGLSSNVFVFYVPSSPTTTSFADIVAGLRLQYSRVVIAFVDASSWLRLIGAWGSRTASSNACQWVWVPESLNADVRACVCAFVCVEVYAGVCGVVDIVDACVVICFSMPLYGCLCTCKCSALITACLPLVWHWH
jgi:hypothetical protein